MATPYARLAISRHGDDPARTGTGEDQTMSIRTRLAIAVVLVLAVTLVLLGVVLVRSTRSTLVAQVDDQVLNNAGRLIKRNEESPGADGGKGGDSPGASGETSLQAGAGDNLYERPVARLVYGPGGQVVVAELAGFLDDPKPPPRVPPIPSNRINGLINHIVTTPAVDGSLAYRMLVERGPRGTYLVTAAPLSEANAAVARLIRILLGVGTVALLAAALVSWWLIRQGLQPVDRMVETAAAIAAGDLSRRVPDADPRTELGQLGHALNDMLGQIERAARAREASEERLRRFVADAAHELRTPLTSLRGYAELYRQGAIPDAEGVGNAMRRIEAEGGRMARLVDDLLLLARLDQQRGLEAKPVDMVELVREAVTDFAAVEPERPITQDLDTEAIVRGDPIRLRQILDNLLANARIHTPAGTPVHVTVKRNSDQVTVTVADEGPGIAPADQARVFERFWRADPARVRSRGGTGLGLAIVASLVHAHGGRVDVISQPGQGSAFSVRLPLAGSTSAVASADHSTARGAPDPLPALSPAPLNVLRPKRPDRAHSQ